MVGAWRVEKPPLGWPVVGRVAAEWDAERA